MKKSIYFGNSKLWLIILFSLMPFLALANKPQQRGMTWDELKKIQAEETLTMQTGQKEMLDRLNDLQREEMKLMGATSPVSALVKELVQEQSRERLEMAKIHAEERNKLASIHAQERAAFRPTDK